MIKRVALAALVLTPMLAGTAAWAQVNNQNNPVSIHPKPEDTLGAPRAAPPPALPGAQSQAGSAAPATKLPTDMAPNDALFDAINRGDIAAARDSLSRGADLNARNLLGMSPMELSVDLGRNDISFLLLSMRGGSPSGTRSVPETALAKASRSSPATRAAPLVKTATRTERASPALFANDGGTPVPDAGFLGYDTNRAVR